MSSREQILRCLKSASWNGNNDSRAVCAPVSPKKGDSDLFVTQASAAGAQVKQLPSWGEVYTQLEGLIEGERLQRVIADDDICQVIDWAELSRITGCEVKFSAQINAKDYRPYVLRACLGVTGCSYAVAETGTVVLAHHHSNERLASHAPDHYLCIIRREQILQDRYDLAAVLEKNLASCAAWTLLTGISRTADVALQVVLGMHGPRKVTYFLVG